MTLGTFEPRAEEPVATSPSWRTRLDPELARAATLQPRFDFADPRAVRAAMTKNIAIAESAGFWRRNDAGSTHLDTTIPGTDVRARLYSPAGATGLRPGIVYLHGGAFVVGDLDTEHPRCLEMCRATGARIVSVDYRLAPEHPFPAALEDCAAAVDWLMRRGEAWNIDSKRIAVAGASAGGCLAAAVTLMRRDYGAPLPVLELLVYPVLDDRLSTSSMIEYHDTPVWDGVNSAHMWRHYLGHEAARTAVSAYAAPARSASLAGLPRTYVVAAEHDPLRDEALIHAQRLLAAGVSTELHLLPGTFHGFDTLSDATVSRRALDEQHAVLRDALTGTTRTRPS